MTANTTSIAAAMNTAVTKSRVVPTGTMAKLETIAGHSYFDPIDTLQDHLGTQPTLLSKVTDSMAWMLDSSCISQARSILFGRYKEVDHTEHDAFNNFCQSVGEDLDHESLYADVNIGYPEHTLAIMLALRNQWHDAAACAASADNRDYKEKTFRELMESEKVKPADIGTRTNYKKLAELEARGDEAKALRLFNSYIEADAVASVGRVDSNKALLPVTLDILRTVNRYAIESSRFDQLPLSMQRRLTTFCIGAVDRSKLDVAKRMAKQPIAFGHIAEAAYQATQALSLVVINKYSDVGELESAGSQVQIDMGRNAKRVACNSFE